MRPPRDILDDALDPDHQDSPMTDAQAAKLRALCAELGEPMDGDLSQRHAMRRITALQEQLSKRS